MKTHPILKPVQGLTDPQLVESIRGGEISALEVLMRRHNRTLYRTARAILHDDAGDFPRRIDVVHMARTNHGERGAHATPSEGRNRRGSANECHYPRRQSMGSTDVR
jgi:hypothetical protein